LILPGAFRADPCGAQVVNFYCLDFYVFGNTAHHPGGFVCANAIFCDTQALFFESVAKKGSPKTSA
jgi:hypothetical protein